MIELNQMVMHYMIDYVCVSWYAREDVRDSARWYGEGRRIA